MCCFALAANAVTLIDATTRNGSFESPGARPDFDNWIKDGRIYVLRGDSSSYYSVQPFPDGVIAVNVDNRAGAAAKPAAGLEQDSGKRPAHYVRQ